MFVCVFVTSFKWRYGTHKKSSDAENRLVGVKTKPPDCHFFVFQKLMFFMTFYEKHDFSLLYEKTQNVDFLLESAFYIIPSLI